jgi:glycerol-3-phosphate dehydrogenase (NAD(P)+)
MAIAPRRSRRSSHGRATVVGAGSFGTAVAILIDRAGWRTTLMCRTEEQAAQLDADRENLRYLAGVALPESLKLSAIGRFDDQFRRADVIFLAVPSSGLNGALEELARQGVPRAADVISLAKGLVPPDGTPPTVALEAAFGPERVGCVGGPAHAREMVDHGAGLVAASHALPVAERVAAVFQRAGLPCEVSGDPVGVELAGCAKNAAALAAGATESQGLNAAGMAAADIFTEVLALAEQSGGQARTFVGRAGTGDLVATALAPTSRNRSAGELLAQGIPASEIPGRLGQAVERAGVPAPVLSALARLVEGTLPLDEWVALVRARQPEPPSRGGRVVEWFRRLWMRLTNRRPALPSGG